jgi:hypothetical protein
MPETLNRSVTYHAAHDPFQRKRIYLTPWFAEYIALGLRRHARHVHHHSVFLIAPLLAMADGYGPWKFGMTKAEVRAITEFGPYYDFRNGDLGSKYGVIDGKQAPISFYFRDGHLIRIMLVEYAGTNYEDAKSGWLRAFLHIQRNFGGTEVPGVGNGPTDVKAAERLIDSSGLKSGQDVKVQMGATPMPKDKVVWCTVNIVPAVGYWVAVNYAEP